MAKVIIKLTDIQCDMIAKELKIVLPPAPDTVNISSDVIRRLMQAAFRVGRGADVMHVKFK